MTKWNKLVDKDAHLRRAVDKPDDLLQSLQYLAMLKLAKYRSQWSKASEDHIERLERDFDDVDKLLVYFTKR